MGSARTHVYFQPYHHDIIMRRYTICTDITTHACYESAVLIHTRNKHCTLPQPASSVLSFLFPPLPLHQPFSTVCRDPRGCLHIYEVACLKISRVGRPACLYQQTGLATAGAEDQKPAGQVLEPVGRLSGIVGLYLSERKCA